MGVPIPSFDVQSAAGAGSPSFVTAEIASLSATGKPGPSPSDRRAPALSEEASEVDGPGPVLLGSAVRGRVSPPGNRTTDLPPSATRIAWYKARNQCAAVSQPNHRLPVAIGRHRAHDDTDEICENDRPRSLPDHSRQCSVARAILLIPSSDQVYDTHRWVQFRVQCGIRASSCPLKSDVNY